MINGMFWLSAMRAEERAEIASSEERRANKKLQETKKELQKLRGELKSRDYGSKQKEEELRRMVGILTKQAADNDFVSIRQKALADHLNPEFINPEEAKLPETVSEVDGRKIHADGSYSVDILNSYGYPIRTQHYMLNGVTRVYDIRDGQLLEEELPDEGKRTYFERIDKKNAKIKLRYEKENSGNYKFYNEEGQVVEEGNKDSWIKYDYENNEIVRERHSSGDYKVYNKNPNGYYIEGNIHIGYTKYDANGNIVEEGNHQTDTYTKYNAKHQIIETGRHNPEGFCDATLVYPDKNDDTAGYWEKPYTYLERVFYDESQQIIKKIINGEDDKESRVKRSSTTYILKSDKSGLYKKQKVCCRENFFVDQYDDGDTYIERTETFDELGRLKSQKERGWKAIYWYGRLEGYKEKKSDYVYMYTYKNGIRTETVMCKGEAICFTKRDKHNRKIESGNGISKTTFTYYGNSNRVMYEKEFVGEKLIRSTHTTYYDNSEDVMLVEVFEGEELKHIKHYDKEGNEDTLKYLTQKRIEEKKEKFFASKSGIVEKTARKIAEGKTFQKIALNVARKRIDQSIIDRDR